MVIDFYTENFKTVLKEIKDIMGGKISHVHTMEKLMLRLTILLKAIYRFSEAPYQNSTVLFYNPEM